MKDIINRVTESSLKTINLEDFYTPGKRIIYDLKDNLFQELILKEKDFREFIKSNNWEYTKDANVAITCSADAIVPTWAFILIFTKISPLANHTVIGDLASLEQSLFQKSLSNLNVQEFLGAKVVVKGCSKIPVPLFAYGELTRLLQPVVQSLMYGEPCSTVPLYKQLSRG